MSDTEIQKNAENLCHVLRVNDYGAFSCLPQARQLILQYGLTLSDLDRHPEVREGWAAVSSSFLMAVTCSWALDILLSLGERSVSHTRFSPGILSIKFG